MCLFIAESESLQFRPYLLQNHVQPGKAERSRCPPSKLPPRPAAPNQGRQGQGIPANLNTYVRAQGLSMRSLYEHRRDIHLSHSQQFIVIKFMRSASYTRMLMQTDRVGIWAGSVCEPVWGDAAGKRRLLICTVGCLTSLVPAHLYPRPHGGVGAQICTLTHSQARGQ